MYSIPSIVIAAALFGLMLVTMQSGRRFARIFQRNEDADAKTQANAVQASLLGLLALLLGFTFSTSLGRYDQRSNAVVDEAKAFSDAFRALDLLQNPDGLQTALKTYGDLRVAATAIDGAHEDERKAHAEKTQVAYDALWTIMAEKVRVQSDPMAPRVAASISALGLAFQSRTAAIDRHVPEMVLALLFLTFIILGGVIGFASAVSDVRPGLPVYAIMSLVAILTFLILDLDRPRRGIVKIDQSPLFTAVAAAIGQAGTLGNMPKLNHGG